MNNRYQIGNAQIIGCREIQSNYFATVFNENDDLLAVLADGTIDHPNGRAAAMMAVEICTNTFRQRFAIVQHEHGNQFLFDTAMKANSRIQETFYFGRSPRVSLAMVLFIGDKLQYFNVGVSKVLLYNGHNERTLGNVTSGSYSSGICEFPQGSIAGLFSAGAHANVHPMERLKIIESKKEVFDKAQAVIDTVRKKGLDNQMNATALLVEAAR
ncbi:MAG: hypothetical protein FWG42_09830 [Clostridiales bacterium]|nr:hypothetical protein [Clostridiales bacterium]